MLGSFKIYLNSTIILIYPTVLKCLLNIALIGSEKCSHQSGLVDLRARLEEQPGALSVPRLGGDEQRARAVPPRGRHQDALVPANIRCKN